MLNYQRVHSKTSHFPRKKCRYFKYHPELEVDGYHGFTAGFFSRSGIQSRIGLVGKILSGKPKL